MKRLILTVLLPMILMIYYGCSNLQGREVVNLNIKYEITSNGKTSKFKFICLVPQDIDKIQKIRSIEYSVKPDFIFRKHGNSYAQFTIHNPRTHEEIEISSELITYINDLEINTKNKRFLSDSLARFVQAEKYIEKDDESIKLKAEELKGETTEQTVENIYKFVNEELKYDGYNPVDMGARKALMLMKGDCSEFSDLFVALCRANNIPARVSQGFTRGYSATPRHAWAQTYFDKHGWVDFDPTPGNLATFRTMQNNYIQLSTYRNDEVINYYNSWAYWYWGENTEVKESISID